MVIDAEEESPRNHAFTRKRDLITALDLSGFDNSHKEYLNRYVSIGLTAHHSRELRFNLIAVSLITDITADAILFAIDRVVRSPASDTIKAAFTVLVGCHTDLKAAIVLIAKGFDLQARNLLRSCRERVDVLGACLLDDDFARAYIAVQDFENANRFWYERVRKGRAKKVAINAWKKRTGAPADLFETDWKEWRDETDEMLSASEHILPAAFFIALFPGVRTRSKKIGLDGVPSNISLRTIRIIMFFVLEIFMYVKVGIPELDQNQDDSILQSGRKSFERCSNLMMIMIDHMYRHPDKPLRAVRHAVRSERPIVSIP